MDNNILLESGSNELEVLEFVINGNHYGINVRQHMGMHSLDVDQLIMKTNYYNIY